MNDKVQKIRKKVEKLKSLIGNNSFLSDYEKGCNDGREDICDELLSFIDSLQKEPVSEDLNKAAEEWDESLYRSDAFKAGAKWQKEQFDKKVKEVFCKARCNGHPPRSTCTSLGTCKEYDNFVKLLKGG